MQPLFVCVVVREIFLMMLGPLHAVSLAHGHLFALSLVSSYATSLAQPGDWTFDDEPADRQGRLAKGRWSGSVNVRRV